MLSCNNSAQMYKEAVLDVQMCERPSLTVDEAVLKDTVGSHWVSIPYQLMSNVGSCAWNLQVMIYRVVIGPGHTLISSNHS